MGEGDGAGAGGAVDALPAHPKQATNSTTQDMDFELLSVPIGLAPIVVRDGLPDRGGMRRPSYRDLRATGGRRFAYALQDP